MWAITQFPPAYCFFGLMNSTNFSGVISASFQKETRDGLSVSSNLLAPKLGKYCLEEKKVPLLKKPTQWENCHKAVFIQKIVFQYLSMTVHGQTLFSWKYRNPWKFMLLKDSFE